MSNDISQFTITSPAAMVQEFRILIKQQDFLTVSFNQGADSFVTLLLEVYPERKALVFDATSDQALNQKLVDSTKNIFTGSPRGVKTQFTTAAAKLVTYEGRLAFMADFPDSLLRLQHREFFRVSAPMATHMLCGVTTPQGEKIKLVVEDISAGGVGLLMAEDAYKIGVRDILPECHLDLKEIGVVWFKLEVRGFKPSVNATTGARMVKMGCSFMDISKQDQVKVQRAILNLEREMMAKVGNMR